MDIEFNDTGLQRLLEQLPVETSKVEVIKGFVDLLTEAGKDLYYNEIPIAEDDSRVRYLQLTHQAGEEDKKHKLAALVNKLATTDWFEGIVGPASVMDLGFGSIYFIFMVVRPEWSNIDKDILNAFISSASSKTQG